MSVLERDGRVTLAERVRLRKWPILVTVVLLVAGMAYSLLWGPVVRHRATWVFPGDIWGAYRSAHFIAWGDVGKRVRGGHAHRHLPRHPAALCSACHAHRKSRYVRELPPLHPAPHRLASARTLRDLDQLHGAVRLGCAGRTPQGLAGTTGRAVCRPGRDPVADSRVLGSSRGRSGPGARGICLGPGARRSVDRCGMAVRRSGRHPASRRAHAPRAARHVGPATSAGVASAFRPACSRAPRHASDCAVPRHRPGSPATTQLPEHRPLHAVDLPRTEARRDREVLRCRRRTGTRSSLCLAPVCSAGGRVVGATGPISSCGRRRGQWPCAASPNR